MSAFIAGITSIIVGFTSFQLTPELGIIDGEDPNIPQAAIAAEHEIWITAYSSTPDQTDDSPFITASNTHVRDGIVATNLLPFGTEVQIPELYGDKIFTVEDRMNRRYTDRMDVWMTTREEALRFGKNRATILVLK